MTNLCHHIRHSLPLALLTLAIGSPAQAAQPQSIDITFKAKIIESTCNVTINGSDAVASITLGGSDGSATLDEIAQYMDGDFNSATMTTFSLEVADCPSSIASVQTTLGGTFPASNTILIPTTADSASGNTSGGVGVRISRSGTKNYLKVFGEKGSTTASDSESIKWSDAELSAGKVDLDARLVTMRADMNNTDVGHLKVTATFNFNYE
ncbi:fimbrial protein [Salmonella enterica]|nr:fimbrial protein [Salmonella enterica]